MEQLGELVRHYWYVIVGGGGILLILGAVFNWKWAVQREGGRRFGLLSWIYDQFCETGYRIAIGDRRFDLGFYGCVCRTFGKVVNTCCAWG